MSASGLLAEIDTVHRDRGYDYLVVRAQLAALGLHDVEIQRRGTKLPGAKKQPLTANAWRCSLAARFCSAPWNEPT